MKKVVYLLLAAAAVICCLTACGNSAPASSATGDSAATATVDEAPLKTYTIATKYADLQYPERWKDKVKTSIQEEPYRISFFNGEQGLFTIYFNAGEGDAIGTLLRDDGNVIVSVTTDALDPKAETYKESVMMQEDVNTILQNLRKDKTFTDTIDADAEESVYAIKTALTTLYYPARWKDKVKVKEEKDIITFSAADTPVFALAIDRDDGFFVGTYGGKNIHIIDYPVKSQEHAAMQEDINVLLRYLEKDSQYKAAY